MFQVSKTIYYKWKYAYEKYGEQGLLRKKRVEYNHPNKIKAEVVEKVLSLRKEQQLGSWRIKWYLERYHDIHISELSVYRILKRFCIGRLNRKAFRRSLHSNDRQGT